MIPKVLHRIWVGSPLPDEFVTYGETWKKHHPEWLHYLWSDQPQPHVPDVLVREIPHPLENETLYGRAEMYAPNSLGQFKSDILRYELLYHIGGVYVDTDFECVRPIDDLLSSDIECFAAWETEHRWVNNAIMGSIPRHPFIQRLIRNLYDNVLLNVGQRPNVLTGPQYLTHQRDDTLTVFPKDYFYPYLWNQLDQKGRTFPNAYAIHHWANMRKRRDHTSNPR